MVLLSVFKSNVQAMIKVSDKKTHHIHKILVLTLGICLRIGL